MKKAILAVLIIASVVGAWAMTAAQEVEAAGCVRCIPGGVTGSAWGMGSTCAAARANAIAAATALIPGSCETCQVTPVLVKDCYGSNPIKADYKVWYKCSLNLCQ